MPIAFVQASAVNIVGTGSGNGATTNSITLTGTTAGNTLIACYGTTNTPAAALAGSVDQGFVKIIETAALNPTTQQHAGGVWFKTNIPGGSIIVTLTTPAACDSAFVLMEYSGLGTAPTVDGSHSAHIDQASMPNPFSSGAATEARTGDLIIGLYTDWGNNDAVNVQDGKNSRGSAVSNTITELVADDLLSSVSLSNSASFGVNSALSGLATASVAALSVTPVSAQPGTPVTYAYSSN